MKTRISDALKALSFCALFPMLSACQSGIKIEPVGVAPSPVKAAVAVPLKQDRVTKESVLHLRDQITQNQLATNALEEKLWAYQVRGFATLPQDDPKTLRLAKIFADVHSKSHLWEMPLKPVLVDRDLFQAYTLGGLEIVFYTGLTDSLSDDGLAIIIGHEIAHIATSHAVEAISRDVVNLQHNHNGEAKLSGFYAVESEFEADMVGLLYAVLAGYNGAKAEEIWNTLADVRERPKFNLFTATHPPDEARGARLAKQAAAIAHLRASENWQSDLVCNPLYCADNN